MAEQKIIEPQNVGVQSSSGELEVKIQTPEEVIWQGRATAVSSKNSAGPFDILPEHANIITLIEDQPIEVVTSQGSHTYRFEKAVLSAKNDHVSIYADLVINKTT